MYKWLFLTFGKKPSPNSPILSFAKKVTGISRFESIENISDGIKSRGFTDTVKDFLTVLSDLCKKIKYLLPHCKIHNFGLTIINAGEDPQATAMGFGGVCAVVYPVLGLIYTNTKQKKDCSNINISCDFTTATPVFDFDCTLSCGAFFILVAFIRLAFEDYRNRKKKNQER